MYDVRDLRQKEQYITDDIFLNGYAKFVEIYGVGVYSSLCRHADKTQKCFPSAKKIAEELNISTPKVFYSFWVLEIFNIIKRKRVGRGCNNRYYLIHKRNWKKPEKVREELAKDISSSSGSDVNTVNIRYKRHLHHLLTTLTSNSKELNSKETHSKVAEDKSSELPSKKEFILEEELRKLRNVDKDKERWKMIIADYISYKALRFKNNTLYQQEFKRCVKPARELGKADCSQKELLNTFKYCDDNFKTWTLNAVLKNINHANK